MTERESPQARARLVDVAGLAGVDVSTASRALNHPEMVNATTRQRVLAAAEALDYAPNLAARGLITGKSVAIAIMVPDLTNSYFAHMCRAAQIVARERGYEVFIVDTGSGGANETDLLRSVSRWVAGIVLCGSTRAYPPRPFGVPVVYVNRRARGSHCVIVDPVSIVRQQIEHLVRLGHERIDWVAGPKWVWAAAPRLRAAERLAAHHDIRILRPEGGDFASGVELAEDHDGRATAIVCYSDRQAFGFVGRFTHLGGQVPGDVSVLGSDDAPGSEYFAPALTTVAVPKQELGRTAVGLLLDHLDDRDRVITETLHATLVARESSAPPRRR